MWNCSYKGRLEKQESNEMRARTLLFFNILNNTTSHNDSESAAMRAVDMKENLNSEGN